MEKSEAPSDRTRHADGEAALSAGDPGTGLAIFQALLADEAGNVPAHLGAAAALLALERPMDALAHYDVALTWQPDSWVAHFGRGAVLHRAGRPEAALDAYDQALRSAPDAAAIQLPRGDVLLALAEPRAAMAAFDAVLAEDPRRIRAMTGRAAALVHLDQFDAAKAAYRQALAVDPESIEAHAGLGCVWLVEREADQALAAFDRCIAAAPMTAKSHWGRGEALLLRQALAEALAAFDRALEIDPDLTDAHAGRSRALQALGVPLPERLAVEALATDDAVEAAVARAPFGDLALSVRFAEGLSGRMTRQAFSQASDGDGAWSGGPSLEDLSAAAGDRCLVYLLPARRRAGAILIRQDGAEWIDLPDLTAAAVREGRARLLAAYGDWRGEAGVRFTPLKAQAGRAETFAQALEDCGAWLWDAGVGRLVERVEQAGLTRCTLVAGARLGLMPLAAARGPDGRYAAERLILSQTPNGACWLGSRRRAPGQTAEAAIIVPRSAPDGARAEALGFAHRCGAERVRLVDAGRATRTAFLQAFSTADGIYFAGHAAADLERPMQSHLDLDDGPLALDELATSTRGGGRPRLVILAGCETGLIGQTLPPAEPLAFPALMNILGVASVVSAHWLLLDRPARAIMEDFQVALLGEDRDPAVALATAQRAAISGRHDRAGAAPHTQPSHPLAWAALHASGA
jgi:tetratricopeptide (TPR) repeat protein